MNISYSQLDITEEFGKPNVGPDTWVTTTPINLTNPDPESSGLPPKDATPDRIYEIGSKLSALRNEIGNAHDGVYCPVCHKANTDINNLDSPCPKCGRKLLRFGWD
jgi:hypothetical protein